MFKLHGYYAVQLGQLKSTCKCSQKEVHILHPNRYAYCHKYHGEKGYMHPENVTVNPSKKVFVTVVDQG